LVSLFAVLNPLLPFFFISLHQTFLFLRKICLLALKLFHSFISSPRPCKFPTSCISEPLTLQLHLLSFCLSGQLWRLHLLTIANIHSRSYSCTICRVDCNSLVFKTMELFVELGWVEFWFL
jgi:hypothetical protein